MYRTQFVEAKSKAAPKAPWWRRMVFVMRGGARRLQEREWMQARLHQVVLAHVRYEARHTARRYADHKWQDDVLFTYNYNAALGPGELPLPLPGTPIWM